MLQHSRAAGLVGCAELLNVCWCLPGHHGRLEATEQGFADAASKVTLDASTTTVVVLGVKTMQCTPCDWLRTGSQQQLLIQGISAVSTSVCVPQWPMHAPAMPHTTHPWLPQHHWLLRYLGQHPLRRQQHAWQQDPMLYIADCMRQCSVTLHRCVGGWGHELDGAFMYLSTPSLPAAGDALKHRCCCTKVQYLYANPGSWVLRPALHGSHTRLHHPPTKQHANEAQQGRGHQGIMHVHLTAGKGQGQRQHGQQRQVAGGLHDARDFPARAAYIASAGMQTTEAEGMPCSRCWQGHVLFRNMEQIAQSGLWCLLGTVHSMCMVDQ
jgi:hypothetical protein